MNYLIYFLIKEIIIHNKIRERVCPKKIPITSSIGVFLNNH